MRVSMTRRLIRVLGAYATGLLLLFCNANAQTIAIYGNTRANQDMHQRIVNEILKSKPVAVFHTGDFSDQDTRSAEWQRFTAILSQLLKIADFYPVLGSHDQVFKNSFQQFAAPESVTWYSVDIGNIHCVVLDSTSDLFEGSPQNQWLRSDLESAAKNKRFIVIFLHHAPFSVGAYTDEKSLQISLVPLCVKYKVAMMFSGINHAYERSRYDATYYIVTGGGGAALFDKKRKNMFNQLYRKAHHYCLLSAQADVLSLRVYDESGNLIDELSLSAQK